VKKIWSFLFIALFLGNLYANEAAVPATASQAFNNHVTNVKKFVDTNKRELKHAAKISSGIAKIGGAIALSYFTFSQGKTLAEFTKNMHVAANIKTTFKDAWINPHLLAPREPNTKLYFKRPPYFTTLAISTYLLYDGSKDLYKEVRKILKEQKENKKVIKNEEVTTPITEEIETPIAAPADITISNEAVGEITMQSELENV
jgi:hypothetical protein